MGRKQLESLLFLPLLAVALGVAGCPRDAVDDKKSQTRIELAKDFLRRGDLEAADAEAKKALEYNRGSADAEYVLGLVGFLRGLGNHRLLEIDDCLTGVDAEALRGEMDGFLAQADEHLGRAVTLDPEHAEAWSSRGSVADQLGDHARAIEHLSTALAHPHRLLDVGVTRANLGWAYFHAGDMVRAAKELRQSIQFNPGMCVARYRLGRVYFAREEWNKAAEQFTAVVSDKSCPMQEAHLYALKTHLKLGALDAAEKARASCVTLAAKSCLAAECKAVPR